MKILEDIKKVFDVCSQYTNENLKDHYMYMCTENNTHYFKHRLYRNIINIEVKI